MNFLLLIIHFLARLLPHLERLEHLLTRVGIAIWHLVGVGLLFYYLIADKIGWH